MSFQDALKKTLQYEGGYVNDPADAGGETNYGVTKKTAMSYGYMGDMKSIPMNVVESIYKKMYWDVNKLDDIDAMSSDISFFMFDAAVNSGPGKAGKWLQGMLNLMNKNQTLWPNISEDGMVGPGTVGTLAKMSRDDYPVAVQILKVLRGAFYLDICRSDGKENQEKFLRGWIKRTI